MKIAVNWISKPKNEV